MHTNKKSKRKCKQVIAIITALVLVSISGIFREVSFVKAEKVSINTVQDRAKVVQVERTESVAKKKTVAGKSSNTFTDVFKTFTSVLITKGIVKTMKSPNNLVYGNYIYTVLGKNVTITGYTGKDRSIVIPDTINGYTVTAIGNSAFKLASSRLTSIELPNSIIDIGDSAFCMLFGLTSIKLSNSIISIGDGAFEGCVNLKNIELPSSITSIGIKAFQACNNLSIYGYTNSYAETYAKENDIPFISIGESPTPAQTAISTFKLDDSANGSPTGNFTFSGELALSDTAEASSAVIQEEIKAIKWTSSDSNIAEITSCVGIENYQHSSATLVITVTPHKEGTVTITGTTSNGLTKSCEVTVGESKTTTTVKHITGTLESVDLNLMAVTINNTKYAVTDSFSISDAFKILMESDCKRVVAVLSNNKVSKMDVVTDIVEPKAQIVLNPSSLSYQDGAFDKTELSATVTLSCGAKSPYWDSDLKDTEAENVSVNFSGYTLQTENGLHFRPTLLSKSKEYTDKSSVTLKFGEKKEFEQTIYIDDGYVPEKVKETLSVSLSASYNSQATNAKATLNIANIDKQAEMADNRNSDSEVSEAEALMDKITLALGEFPGYTESQKKHINAVVKAWIADILVTNVLIQDTSSNSLWAEFCKGAGYSNPEIKDFVSKVAAKAFKKVGFDIASAIDVDLGIQWNNMEASTTIKVPVDGKKKKYDMIELELNFGNLAFTGGQAFTGMGNITYTIKTADGKINNSGLNVGVVTFADLEKFAAGVEKICKKGIKDIYNLDLGPNIQKGKEWMRKALNENTQNKIVEIITSDTVNKLIEKKYGKFTDNVFTLYYDELKDTTESKYKKQKKSTKGSVHCPVDVYIYNSQGELCGSIINNQIETDTGDIFLYCEGDEKFFTLTGDNYSIKLVGNDEGKMTYNIEEYLGTQLLRKIDYKDVSLNDGKSYMGMVFETQLLDSAMYNLISDDAEVILPSLDIVYPSDEGEDNNSPTDPPIVEESPKPQETLIPQVSFTPQKTTTPIPTLKVSSTPPVTKTPTLPPVPATIKKGTKITVKNSIYKVISPSKKTVSFSGLLKKNKKKVTIPATITYNSQKYKVTSIKENAFSQNKTITTVVIGKNVTDIGTKAFCKCKKLAKITISSKVGKIGKQAFYGCGKLKSIIIKTTKLTTKNVGNKAFKGIAKKAVIKVPKSKKKAYQKLLRKVGTGNQVMVK